MMFWYAAVACKAPPEVAVPADSAPAPISFPVHISLDDAPWQFEKRNEPLRPADQALADNQTLVATLRARNIPASVFVNCTRRSPGDATVSLWHDAGFEVGNHSASHLNLNKVPLEEWLADVRACDEELEAVLPAPPKYFRFPYLMRGNDAETRDAADRGLAEMGYRHAPVTVADTEWLFAFAYRHAETDEAKAAIVADYRAHMTAALDAGRAQARKIEGREVPQIVLFHVNELSRDHIDAVLEDYAALGARFVSMDEALADPVYSRAEVWENGGGSWLWRITPPNGDYWYGEEEGRVEEKYGWPWPDGTSSATTAGPR